MRPSLDEPKPKAEPASARVADEVLPASAVTSADRAEAARGVSRYVLLATLWSSGAAPQSLSGSNGLVALAIPADSSLAGLFQKGKSYHFESDDYRADFRCLEIFPSADEALAVYPDGMRVSVTPATFLRWRQPSEATAASRYNWSMGS
jgi:hypothetical protein